MGKEGLFDLEKHFAFYGAYHKNPINILIHTVFVWPIVFATLVILHFVPPLFSLSHIGFLPSGFRDQGFVLSLDLFLTVIYSLFYICLDKKAGSLAALLCFVCWVGASSLAVRLGFSLAWKFTENWAVTMGTTSNVTSHPLCVIVVLAAQLCCWTGQFLGHGVFEKRAPALLDNLVQALVMAPLFVLLEVLQTCCGYEPYPGFHASVKAKIEAELKEFEDKKQKKIS